MGLTMFPATKQAIADEIDRLTEVLKADAQEKKRSGHITDGDMMDDPIMHQQMEKIGMMQAQVVTLRRYLQEEIEFYNPDSLASDTSVSLGHRVAVRVRYGSGAPEEYFVTLGSKLDSQFLSGNKKLFDGLDEVLISEDSFFGQGLMGTTCRQSFTYQSPGGVNTVEVLRIEASPLVTMEQVI